MLGSRRMGGGRIFLKLSVPLSLMKTYQMGLISASLDSTFNPVFTYLWSVLDLARRYFTRPQTVDIQLSCIVYIYKQPVCSDITLHLHISGRYCILLIK